MVSKRDETSRFGVNSVCASLNGLKNGWSLVMTAEFWSMIAHACRSAFVDLCIYQPNSHKKRYRYAVLHIQIHVQYTSAYLFISI